MEHDSIRRVRRLMLLAGVAALGACAMPGRSVHRPTIDVDGRAGWAVLPLRNLSSTPLAGRQAGALIETRLHRQGVSPLQSMPDEPRPTLAALLERQDQAETARTVARRTGHRYALGGSVHEWHYKGAPDREPVVGVSLRLEDLHAARVVWQASAARTGWGRASLSSVADRVIGELMAELRIVSEPS